MMSGGFLMPCCLLVVIKKHVNYTFPMMPWTMISTSLCITRCHITSNLTTSLVVLFLINNYVHHVLATYVVYKLSRTGNFQLCSYLNP